jgi:hypothetical protein
MKKYEYNKDEKLTGVRVNQVWLKEDLLQNNSEFNSTFPKFRKFFDDENNSLDAVTRNYFKALKNLILSSKDLFLLFIDTDTKTEKGASFGCRVFLTDRKNFMEITGMMVVTNLAGCRFKSLDPPFEDFINEFIGEMYF